VSPGYRNPIIEGFSDDFYMIQADVALNGGSYADIWVRFIDINNGYRVRLTSGGSITLDKMVNGDFTLLQNDTYTTGSTVAVKVKIYLDGSDERFKVWVGGALEINTTDSTHAAGGVALSGDKARFNNLEIGYDDNDDDDIDDAGDDIVRDEDYDSPTGATTTHHDHAGNLIDNGMFRYVYDAWNRLVKVQSSEDSGATTFQEAEFDGTGRRMKKVVTNSGDSDGTMV